MATLREYLQTALNRLPSSSHSDNSQLIGKLTKALEAPPESLNLDEEVNTENAVTLGFAFDWLESLIIWELNQEPQGNYFNPMVEPPNTDPQYFPDGLLTKFTDLDGGQRNKIPKIALYLNPTKLKKLDRPIRYITPPQVVLARALASALFNLDFVAQLETSLDFHGVVQAVQLGMNIIQFTLRDGREVQITLTPESIFAILLEQWLKPE